MAEPELVLDLFVPMKPVSKARPRVTSFGAYTPKATKAAEEIIQAHARNAYRGKPWHCSIFFELVVHLKEPQRPKLPGQPIVKPDWDNYAKLVCDALNGIVYHDDCQIVSATVRKVYSDREGFEVRVYKYL